MQKQPDVYRPHNPVAAMGMPPTAAMRRMPGHMWLDATDRGWDDVALCGIETDPATSSNLLRAHTLIAYLDGKPRLTRSYGGCETAADMAPGCLALKDANTTGPWSWDQAKRTINVFLSPHLLQNLAIDIYGPGAGSPRLRDCTRMYDDELLSLVHSLAREAASDEPGATVMVKTLAQQIAVRLIRHHADMPETLQRREVFDGAQRRHIVQYIASNLNQPISVATLAEREDLGVDRFSRLFRNSFDCSPQQHMRNLRLQRVLELMEDPALSLAEIAYETGFTDQSHLTRVFKCHHGMPPGIWRSQRVKNPSTAKDRLLVGA